MEKKVGCRFAKTKVKRSENIIGNYFPFEKQCLSGKEHFSPLKSPVEDVVHILSL